MPDPRLESGVQPLYYAPCGGLYIPCAANARETDSYTLRLMIAARSTLNDVPRLPMARGVLHTTRDSGRR